MNLHRLRLSAWSERVYLKYHRPHRTFFGYIPGFGPPGALKSAIWRRFSIDFCRIRAPMRGHRKMACFSHISPHDRCQEGQRDRETNHALLSHKAITFGMFDGSPVHRKERGALGSHFHGVGGHRRRRCPWRFWRIPRAPNQGYILTKRTMRGRIG